MLRVEQTFEDLEGILTINRALTDSLVGKKPTCNAGDPGSIPGLGRSSGEGIGYPLQYSGLENSMDCIVHGVAKTRICLSNFHYHLKKQAQLHALYKKSTLNKKPKRYMLEDIPCKL